MYRSIYGCRAGTHVSHSCLELHLCLEMSIHTTLGDVLVMYFVTRTYLAYWYHEADVSGKAFRGAYHAIYPPRVRYIHTYILHIYIH